MLDGKRVRYTPAMRFPERRGVLSFDFVWDSKPPDDALPMKEEPFESMFRTTLKQGATYQFKINTLHQASQTGWFSGRQVEKLLLVHRDGRLMVEVTALPLWVALVALMHPPTSNNWSSDTADTLLIRMPLMVTRC